MPPLLPPSLTEYKEMLPQRSRWPGDEKVETWIFRVPIYISLFNNIENIFLSLYIAPCSLLGGAADTIDVSPPLYMNMESLLRISF